MGRVTASGQSRILLVDEDAEIQKRISGLLQENGFEVQIASDGMSAIHAARKNRPDLILMNIKMPGGGGILILKRLKQMNLTSSIPVIVYTNESAEEFKAEALAIGAVDYVSKQIPHNKLIAKISEVIGKKTPVEELDAVLWKELESDILQSNYQSWLGIVSYLVCSVGNNPQLYESAKTLTHLYFGAKKPDADRLCIGFGVLAAVAALQNKRVAAAIGISNLLKKLRGSETVCEQIKKWAANVGSGGEFNLQELGKMNSKFEALLGEVLSEKRSPAGTKQLSFFRGLNAAQVYEIIEKSSPKSFSKAEVIYKKGEAPEEFFIIVDGVVRIESDLGEPHRLLDHDFFGEVALLLNRQTHFHQATAETDVELLSFSKLSLVEVFAKFPDVEINIESKLAFRSFLNHNIESSMFDRLAPEELNELFYLFRVKRVSSGSVLFQENQKADQFYLLLEGEVALSESGEKVRDVEPGHFIGEMAFLEKGVHSKTAKATKDSIFLEVDKQDFENASLNHPKFEFLIRDLASFRRAENKNSLSSRKN